jgi:hypothetical protein
MQPFGTIVRAKDYGLIKGIDLKPGLFDWNPPKVSSRTEAILTRIPRSLSILPTLPESQWLDPARDTRAQKYQDQGFDHDLQHGALDDTVYEIARFFSPIDSVGIVKYVGTWVQIVDPDSGNPVELDFSNPFAMQQAGLKARFLLRYDQGTPDNKLVFPDLPWIGPLAEVTGYGYGPLPEWNDYRFYWGRYANNVWWLVPKRHAIRLYLHVIGQGTYLRKTLGRLQGYTQPAATLPAAYNVSHGW